MSNWREEFEVRTYTHIWYPVLEKLIEKHLGRKVAILEDLEAGNDSHYVFGGDEVDIDEQLAYLERVGSGYQVQTMKAIFELRKMNVLPKEHPVLLWVMW